jgi:hypothetical protein
MLKFSYKMFLFFDIFSPTSPHFTIKMGFFIDVWRMDNFRRGLHFQLRGAGDKTRLVVCHIESQYQNYLTKIGSFFETDNKKQWLPLLKMLMVIVFFWTKIREISENNYVII